MTKYEESFLSMIAMLTMFGLTDRQLHAFMLRFFANMEYRDIGSTLGITHQGAHYMVQDTLIRIRRQKKLLYKII